MSERDQREAGPDDLPPELRQVAEVYAAQPVPRPTPHQTNLLLARLLAEEPVAALTTGHTRPRVDQTLRIARWRVRLLGRQFWVTSVIMLTLAAWATRSYYLLSGTAPLLLTVPLTGVLGVAYALRTSSRGLREVEASAPLGFAEAAAGLVLAIAGFDCALGSAATLAVCQTTAQPFLALLTVWLGPLLLLTALSLPVALRWGALAAALVGGAPWALLVLATRLRPDSPLGVILTLPHDAGAAAPRLVLAMVGLALLVAMVRHGPLRLGLAALDTSM